MAISHVFTNPVPDGTITSIVRPSDWNSAHNQYYTLSGNVLGASTVSGTNVVFQAGANVSLSGTGGTIVIQGTNTPQPTSYVSNVNGLSGAVSLAVGSSLSSSANGSSITFGLASNITTALQSANSNYLTTQTVQTQASGNIAGTGFTSTTTAGTAVVGTLGTDGLSVGVPAYLTTQSVQTQASGNIVRSGFTSTTTAGTAIVGTQNSQGLSLGVPAYLTTQSVQTQASGNIAGTGFTSTTTAGTAVVGTLGTGGLSIGVPAFLTTAAGGGGVAIAGGTQTATSGTVVFSNSNGVTFGLNNGTLTASAAGAAGMYANLSGNTTGNTTASGSTLNFSGINITLSGTNNSQIAISAPAASGLSNGNNIAISSTGSTIGISAQAIAAAAGTQTATSGTVNFANSNGISFGMSGSSQITASYTVPTQSVQTQASGNIAGSGFTGVNATGTLNSNGLSLSVAAPSAANYSIGVSNLGNTAGSTGITGTRIVFVGTNNISLSQSTDANGATISINQTGGGGGGIAAAAGTQTATSGTVNFANSNGITFGMSGSNQITASYTVPTVPTSYVSNVNGSSGQISLNVGSSLSSSTAGSSITFGLASNITTALQSANANYLTSQSNQAFSASGGSSTFQTLNFANSNGLTFSNSGGSVVASYTVPTQSVQTQASGNIAGTGFTSTTTAGTAVTAALGTNGLNMAIPAYLTTQSVQTQASGAIAGTGFTSTTTAGTAVVGTLSTNGLSLGVPAYLTAAAGGNFSGGVSNLGNTAGSTGITGTRVVFVGTNNISLSQSTDANGATISINQTGGGGGAMYANLSGATSGNTTASGSTLNFSGVNITLSGTNNSQIAISAPATSSLSAGNNISISTNGSTIIVSARAVALSAGTQTATSGTVNFANSNGITFGMSGSNQITASYTVPPSFSAGISNLGNTAGSTGISGTRIVFVGTNNISLSQSTDANGATISINQTGGGGGGLTNINLSAGTTSNNLSKIVFNDANNVSFGLNGSTVTASIATSLTNVNVSAGTTSNNLSNIVFSNTNGVSFGLNGSTVTASVAPAGGVIASGYSPHGDYPMVVGEMGQASLVLDPDIFPDLTVDQIAIPINFSHATNSTGSFTISNWIGLYSRSNSSISLAHSTSFSTGITFSGTQNSVSHVGMRLLTYNWSTSVSGGRYWIAQMMRTTTGGANCSFSQYLASQINSSFLGPFGIATNATYQFTLGQGFYSTSTTALPASIAYSQIRGAGSTTGSLGLRFPIVQFGFNTV